MTLEELYQWWEIGLLYALPDFLLLYEAPNLEMGLQMIPGSDYGDSLFAVLPVLTHHAAILSDVAKMEPEGLEFILGFTLSRENVERTAPACSRC